MVRYASEYYSPDEVYPTEAQVQSGIDYGPNSDDFTGTLVVSDSDNSDGGGESGAADGFTVNLCVSGVQQDGEVLRLKEGADQTLAVSDLPFTPTGTALLGVRDSAGRFLIRVVGTFSELTAEFPITSKEALKLYEGTHRYDIFSLDNYNPDDGSYDSANFLLGSKVVVLPLNLRLEI